MPRNSLGWDHSDFSVQALAEFYVNAKAKFKLPKEKVMRIFESLESDPTLPASESAVYELELKVRKRYQISN